MNRDLNWHCKSALLQQTVGPCPLSTLLPKPHRNALNPADIILELILWLIHSFWTEATLNICHLTNFCPERVDGSSNNVIVYKCTVPLSTGVRIPTRLWPHDRLWPMKCDWKWLPLIFSPNHISAMMQIEGAPQPRPQSEECGAGLQQSRMDTWLKLFLKILILC